MKTLMMAPQISANIYAHGSADRFEGLGSDEQVEVEVCYRPGGYEAPDRAFYVIEKVTAPRLMTLPGSETASGQVWLKIPAGYDITDLFTRAQIEQMEEELTRLLLKGYEL